MPAAPTFKPPVTAADLIGRQQGQQGRGIVPAEAAALNAKLQKLPAYQDYIAAMQTGNVARQTDAVKALHVEGDRLGIPDNLILDPDSGQLREKNWNESNSNWSGLLYAGAAIGLGLTAGAGLTALGAAGAAAPATTGGATLASLTAPTTGVGIAGVGGGAPVLAAAAPAVGGGATTASTAAGIFGGIAKSSGWTSLINTGVNTAASLYASAKEREAAQATAALQSSASDKQLQFLREQAAQDQQNVANANTENRRQFDLTTGLNLQQYNDREARLAPYRATGVNANATLSNLIGFTPGGGGGAAPRAMPTLSPDAQAKFNAIFPGDQLTPDMLKQNEQALQAAGFKLRPNAAGVVGKVQYGDDPNAVIDVIQGAGSGVNKKQWLYGPSGSSALAVPTGTLQSFVTPTSGARSTPDAPLTPALVAALQSPYAATLRSFLSPTSLA